MQGTALQTCAWAEKRWKSDSLKKNSSQVPSSSQGQGSLQISSLFLASLNPNKNLNEAKSCGESWLPFTRAPSGAYRKGVWRLQSGNNTSAKTLIDVTELERRRKRTSWNHFKWSEKQQIPLLIQLTDISKENYPMANWFVDAQQTDLKHRARGLSSRFTWVFVGVHPLTAKGKMKIQVKSAAKSSELLLGVQWHWWGVRVRWDQSL